MDKKVLDKRDTSVYSWFPKEEQLEIVTEVLQVTTLKKWV